MESTYLSGQARPQLWRPENPQESHPGRESERDRAGKVPRNTHHLRRGPPPLPVPAGLPLRVFLQPHFRRSALSHCARLGAGAAPARALRRARRKRPPHPEPRPSRFRRRSGCCARAFYRVSGVRSGSGLRLLALVRLEVYLPRFLFLLDLESTGKACGGSLWFSTGRRGARGLGAAIRLGRLGGSALSLDAWGCLWASSAWV